MRIDVISLFPEVIQPYVTASIIGRAQTSGLVDIRTHQLRDFSTDSHKKVDDRPFGGGPGMVLMCQPVCDAVAAVEAMSVLPVTRILLTPQGKKFNQTMAGRFAKCGRLLFICGHYEGFDERIVDLLQPEEVSLGDFVMTGGEIAALAIVDSVVRLLPGALGHEAAAANESFQGNLLDCPQYTRPRDYRGLSAPDVLLSGNHAEVARWRAQEADRRTRERRPDLLDVSIVENAAAHRGEHSLNCGDGTGLESRQVVRSRGARGGAAALQNVCS